MRIIIIAITFLFTSIGSDLHADIARFVYSTSGSDPLAGSDFELQLGETGQIFTWISTDVDTSLNGISLHYLSDNPNILEATNNIILNPNDRWTGTNEGTLGDLVIDSNAVVFFGDGLATNNLDSYSLHSITDVLATEIGFTNLSFDEGSLKVTSPQYANSVWNDVARGAGTFRVTAAVPEPGSGSLLLLSLVGFSLRRNRR